MYYYDFLGMSNNAYLLCEKNDRMKYYTNYYYV